jgi:peptide-methionine (S)-S-oxide reductase
MRLPLVAATAAFLLVAGSAPAASTLKTAVFAGGCFWSMEKALEHLPGVKSAVSGYAGGTRANPTYENHEGYLEAVQVTYDPAKVSYARLVAAYFHSIDPTDNGGQICDRGPSYRTAVFAGDAQEAAMARAAKAQVASVLKKPVATEIRPAARFWRAEDYHQDYAANNPAAYNAYRVGCGRDAALKAVWGSVH